METNVIYYETEDGHVEITKQDDDFGYVPFVRQSVVDELVKALEELLIEMDEISVSFYGNPEKINDISEKMEPAQTALEAYRKGMGHE